MTPVFQTRFGKDGNCWAACLATLFDVPLSEVDHCSCDDNDWWENTEAWLRKRGMFQIQIRIETKRGKIRYPFVAMPDDTLCCVVGPKHKRDLKHVVVAKTYYRKLSAKRGEQLFVTVHDPLPGSNGTLHTITDVIFFGKLL